ncbi:MAG: cyanophycinase [Terracidiphilus sp.]
MFPTRSLVLVLVLAALAAAAQTTSYQYIRSGNPADAPATQTRPGFALMGGGADLDEAFRFLCERSGGGDFLILRAHGGGDYNPYTQKLCRQNSVATLIVPSRAAAMDPFVAQTIAHASALFIAGGDQANYINFWMGTPVQESLNDAIRRGIPLGGTSAGLAVMGEYGYSAQGDKPEDKDLDSKAVLARPLHPRVTLEHGFLEIPILKGVVTDTHFAKRDRMGRLLVFLARLNEPDGKPLPPPGMPPVRGIGVQERAAVLVEPDGKAQVVGHGPAFFIDAAEGSGVLADNQPVSFGPYAVQRVEPGHSFNLKTWTGEATAYSLAVKNGKLRSTQAGGAVY